MIYTINTFRGAPLCLGVWMSRAHFDAILAALSFTDHDPPPFLDKFWEVRQMIDAWGSNMNNAFALGYMNCLDESMSMWTNKFTCPGFMFVPRKPWPFRMNITRFVVVCLASCGELTLLKEKIICDSLVNRNMRSLDQWLGCCFECFFQFFILVLLLFSTVAFVF